MVEYESHPAGSAADKIWEAQLIQQSREGQFKCSLSTFVLYEDSPIRLLWNALIILLLLYTGIIYLYRMAFYHFRITRLDSTAEPLHEDNLAWEIIDQVIYMVFLVDLVAYFFFSYQDKYGFEVDSMKRIASHYFRGYFWLNLIACIPERVILWCLHVFVDFEGGGHVNSAARILRLQRLSRFSRVLRLGRLTKFSYGRRAFVKWINQTSKYMKVMNLFFGLLWTAHILACGWYICAALHHDRRDTWVFRYSFEDMDPFDQWMRSMYFILTVFTTVGFGDLCPVTNVEIGYVFFVMFVGAVVHSIVIGEVINVVTSHSAMETFIEQKADLVECFAKHVELPEDTAGELRTCVSTSSRFWMTQYYDKEEMRTIIMGKFMPRDLLGRLPRHLFRGELCRNNFMNVCKNFAALPPRLPMLVALAVHRSTLMEGEMIYQANDVPFNIFLVIEGCIAYVATPSPTGGTLYMGETLHTDNQITVHHPSLRGKHNPRERPAELAGAPGAGPELSPYQLFPRGTYFGDIELFLAIPRLACSRCEIDGSVVLILSKKEVLSICEEFPAFGVRWKAVARHKTNKHRRELKKLVKARTYREFAACTIQLWFRRWKSARRTGAGASGTSGGIDGKSLTDRMHNAGQANITVNQAVKSGGIPKNLNGEVKELRETVESLKQDVRTLLHEFRQSQGAMPAPVQINRDV